MIPTTTVERALAIIAPRFGLTVEDNRDELVKRLNEIRSLLYASYHRYDIAVDRKVCLPIEQYCLDCHPCKTQYYGITLPYDAASPESIKIYESEITRKGYQRDFQECGCLTAWDVAGRVPVQKDITCGCHGQLLFSAETSEDHGKIVEVEFRDSAGALRKETVELGDNARTNLAASQVLGVSLPSGRKGAIRLFWKNGDDDTHLSTYQPSEISPQYHRVRFNIKCTSLEVQVVYARKFLEVSSDSELVETDSPYALGEFAAYMSINNRRNNSDGDRREAEVHRANAENAIVGIKTREEGYSQLHSMDVRFGLSRRSGLAMKRR
jgi:hypothetical protein